MILIMILINISVLFSVIYHLKFVILSLNSSILFQSGKSNSSFQFFLEFETHHQANQNNNNYNEGSSYRYRQIIVYKLHIFIHTGHLLFILDCLRRTNNQTLILILVTLLTSRLIFNFLEAIHADAKTGKYI